MPEKHKQAKSAERSSEKTKSHSKSPHEKRAGKKDMTTCRGLKDPVISSEVVFRVRCSASCHDKLLEPGGKPSERDVIRHNGSVVILAVDKSKSKKDPYIVMEYQYRHAAKQYLWELPAGKLEPTKIR